MHSFTPHQHLDERRKEEENGWKEGVSRGLGRSALFLLFSLFSLLFKEKCVQRRVGGLGVPLLASPATFNAQGGLGNGKAPPWQRI